MYSYYHKLVVILYLSDTAGGDGLIFALPGKEGCDYTMRIYNSDGSEPQMCGNGIRCMARFLADVVEQREPGGEVSYNIWTNAGKIVPRVSLDSGSGAGGLITVDMGQPILQASAVPTTLAATKGEAAVDASFKVQGIEYRATCVSMGNPHAVMFFDDLEKLNGAAFDVCGPLIESNREVFPQKVSRRPVVSILRAHC